MVMVQLRVLIEIDRVMSTWVLGIEVAYLVVEIIGLDDNLTNKHVNVDDKIRIILHIY